MKEKCRKCGETYDHQTAHVCATSEPPVAGSAIGSASFAGLHPWWKIANERRSELIGRKHNPLAKPLTETEALELKQLQELAGMVRHWLTPTIPERLMPNMTETTSEYVKRCVEANDKAQFAASGLLGEIIVSQTSKVLTGQKLGANLIPVSGLAAVLQHWDEKSALAHSLAVRWHRIGDRPERVAYWNGISNGRSQCATELRQTLAASAPSAAGGKRRKLNEKLKHAGPGRVDCK